MPIIVKDETANMVVLTIDNNGNMAFGDGTPINMLTLNGYGIIDSEGYIVHGLGSSAVFPASGTVNCGIGQIVRIDTTSGVVPIAVVDTSYPAAHYWIDFCDPSDPTQGGTESVVNIDETLHSLKPNVGSFDIWNNNQGDGYVNDPNGAYYDSSLASAPVGYRWV
jgi:hypothetical protein